jgi:hypothetical protein
MPANGEFAHRELSHSLSMAIVDRGDNETLALAQQGCPRQSLFQLLNAWAYIRYHTDWCN